MPVFSVFCVTGFQFQFSVTALKRNGGVLRGEGKESVFSS